MSFIKTIFLLLLLYVCVRVFRCCFLRNWLENASRRLRKSNDSNQTNKKKENHAAAKCDVEKYGLHQKSSRELEIHNLFANIFLLLFLFVFFSFIISACYIRILCQMSETNKQRRKKNCVRKCISSACETSLLSKCLMKLQNRAVHPAF